MNSSGMCLAEIDGQPLPADLVPLLISAYVDDSQRLPDMFMLRFRDPGRIVLAKANAKIGSAVKISVQAGNAQTPAVLIQGEITALEAEFDAGGTFTIIRGYDQAHRLFRGRRTTSYVQMTASDIVKQVAQRAGLKVGEVASTSTVFPHVSQAGQTDWELLVQLARDNGYEVAVREGSVLLHRAHHRVGRSGGRRSRHGQPPGARAGPRPAALPVRAELGPAGDQDRGARLGRGDEAAPDGHGPG